MSRLFSSRGLALALGAALWLGASPAGALSLSGLAVSLGGGNSANVFVNGASDKTLVRSSVGVVSSAATSFTTRYAAVVGADKDGAPGSTTPSATLNASYTITFQVNASLGQSWSVLLTTSLVGAMTIVSDGKGAASATVGAVTGTASGAGSLSGSLGLAAPGTLDNQASPATSLDSGFNAASGATISGVGTGAPQTVTLNFSWQMTATTIPQGSSADEAAVRLGIDGALTNFSADNYPGPGARTLANDGQFVSATLIPEPASMLMMFAGLVGLALLGRRTAQ